MDSDPSGFFSEVIEELMRQLDGCPRNPLVDAVWMDENFIGQVLRLARKTHSRRTHISVLYRYTAGSATRPPLPMISGYSLPFLAGLKVALREASKLVARTSVYAYMFTFMLAQQSCMIAFM